MRDIARATNLSQSTVSRVLNRTPTIVPIAEDTRERVLATAMALGYRPNPLARGLRGASTMLLGVIVRDITDPFFAGAVDAVTAAAAGRGYNVVLGHAHARAEEAITLWGVLEARHCDAILLLGDMRDQPRLLEDLAGAHVPVVALWQGTQATGVASVAVDNEAGIRTVLDHLTELGHQRIAFVGGRRLGDIKEREETFVRYLVDKGSAPRDGYLRHGSNDPESAIAALEQLLALSEPPTAVVAATDVLAIGLLHAAHRHDKRVPEQLSITGFDDIPMAAYTVPALTTVRMPVREMVEQAVQLALDGRATSAARSVPVLRPTLVARASTGRVAG
ncbi:MAG TPA: LacI family DNA-binding transcriptional regulator [Jatrophihabitans sp.]|jgi:DNA-binding LacI/PurR family transcriptional regulator|nr:LacI family DNA-binding transcriptional regulator [Jatrophihabitans sp.]